MQSNLKSKVHEFWNNESCGESLYLKNNELESYIDHSKERYKLEPFILSFVNFESTRGKKVLVSLVSPYKEQRDGFKIKMGSDLLEVYVHTSEIRGRESFFVQDYEPPTENYIDVCTDNITIEECIDKIMDLKL